MYTETRELFNTMLKDTGNVLTTYQAYNSRTYRDSLQIPDLIWKELSAEYRGEIDRIRREVPAKYRDQKSTNTHEHRPGQQTLPNQYASRANTNHIATNMNTDEPNDKDDDSGEHPDDFTDDDILYFYNLQCAHETQPEDIVVYANLEWTVSHEDKVYALSDGGADSSILGRHSYVLSDSGRFATLVGYNPANTETKHVPIVSAYLKCCSSHDNICVFLKINEAPWIKDNPITLLSEYQICHHRYRIDSTSSHHPAYTTSGYGAQRLELNNVLHIPFENRGAIMGFEILPIDDTKDFTDGGEL